LLVASVRTREAFVDLLGLGVGAITVAPRLLAGLLDQPETLDAERAFLADAHAAGDTAGQAAEPPAAASIANRI
jgi:transaldolase